MKAIPCSQVKINDNIHNSHFNLSNFLCPDLSLVKEKFMKGGVEDAKFFTLELNIRICDENNSNCKNRTKLEELKKGQKIWINTINLSVDYNIDKKESLHSKMKVYYQLFNPFGYSYNEFFLQNMNQIPTLGIYLQV